MTGEDLTRWTIRLALAAYAGRLAWGLTRPAAPHADSASRIAWTGACLFLWLHVACAFHFHHGWSHLAATTQTARDTARVTGIDWGGGIWFNYALLGLWTADVLLWWIAPARHRRRSRTLETAWQSFVAFMAFNATVVFEEGPIRWVGCLVTVGLSIAWILNSRGRYA
jgi:hypothetical protein